MFVSSEIKQPQKSGTYSVWIVFTRHSPAGMRAIGRFITEPEPRWEIENPPAMEFTIAGWVDVNAESQDSAAA